MLSAPLYRCFRHFFASRCCRPTCSAEWFHDSPFKVMCWGLHTWLGLWRQVAWLADFCSESPTQSNPVARESAENSKPFQQYFLIAFPRDKDSPFFNSAGSRPRPSPGSKILILPRNKEPFLFLLIQSSFSVAQIQLSGGSREHTRCMILQLAQGWWKDKSLLTTAHAANETKLTK